MANGWQSDRTHGNQSAHSAGAFHHERKLGELEVGLAETRADVGAIRREIHSLTSTVGQLADYVKTNSKPNWGGITSVAAVMVTMLMAFAAFFGTGIAQNQTALTKLQNIIRTHELKAGHPENVLERTQENKERLRILEDRLQVEMRNLDAVLQREILLNKESVGEIVKTLKERINAIDESGSRRWNRFPKELPRN